MVFVPNIALLGKTLGAGVDIAAFQLAGTDKPGEHDGNPLLRAFGLDTFVSSLQGAIGDQRLTQALAGMRSMNRDVFGVLNFHASFGDLAISVDARTAPQLQQVGTELVGIGQRIEVLTHEAKIDIGKRIELQAAVDRRNQLGLRYLNLQRTGSASAVEELRSQFATQYASLAGYERLIEPGTDVVLMIRQASPAERNIISGQLALAKGLLAAQIGSIAAEVQELEYLLSTGATTTDQQSRLDQLVRQYNDSQQQLAKLAEAEQPIQGDAGGDPSPAFLTVRNSLLGASVGALTGLPTGIGLPGGAGAEQAGSGSALIRHPRVANALGDGVKSAIWLPKNATREQSLAAGRELLAIKRPLNFAARLQYEQLVRGKIELTHQEPVTGKPMTVEQFDGLDSEHKAAVVSAELAEDTKRNERALRGDFGGYDEEIDFLGEASGSYETWRQQEDRLVERRLEERRLEAKAMGKYMDWRQQEQAAVAAGVDRNRAERDRHFQLFRQPADNR